MKRIQRLHLRNFKAFTDQVFDFTTPPERLDGQNVLIYGNNGSGKSSLFWALYTFLQSAGKQPGEVAKYFVPLDGADTNTYQSLRHVFATPDEESFVEITWADVPAAGTSAQRIGLDPPSQDEVTGQQRSIPERTRQDPSKGKDTTIREANLGSDFIHYRYLQDFYQRSNREEVNVWPVFMRDLFPFYPTLLFIGANGTPKMLGDVMRDLLQESKSRERWHVDPKREFEERVTKANQAIGQFVNNVQTNANAFLHKYFLGDNNSLSVTLRYQGQLSFDLFRAAPDTAVEREWRNENDDLRIILSVEIRKPDKPPVTHFRPQSFLNEAQLTRIALAVRLGALLTRAQNSEMKLLCLDDLLISLDMVNRKHVLDWLFGEGGRYCREYQIICLTHDRELYRMLRHYIAKPEAGQWKIFELVNNEYYPTPQPSVLDGGSNDHLSQAWRRFYDQDYPACANYLRKETERLLKEILPPADIYRLPSNDGESVPIPLGTQIEKLKALYKKHEGKWDKLDDLKLFKEVLLNPLSHDSFSTTVYQNELHELLTVIIPTLRKVNRQAIKELEKDQATLIYLTAVASSGISYTYTIQLHESLWQFTFQDGETAYSHPACQVLSREGSDGSQQDFDEGSGSCVDLEDAYRKIRYALGAAPALGEKVVSIPEQPLHAIVTTTP